MESLAPSGTTLDVAVNCAGRDVARLLVDYTMDEFHAVLETNTRGLFCSMQEQIRRKRVTGRGAIVNVTFVAASRPLVSNAIYNARKSAVSMLTRTAAAEEGPNGIRINEVAPGPVLTPMLEGFFEDAAGSAWSLASLRDSLPLRQFSTPADIAHAVLFLASSKASNITGACLAVDGGMCLM